MADPGGGGGGGAGGPGGPVSQDGWTPHEMDPGVHSS